MIKADGAEVIIKGTPEKNNGRNSVDIEIS